MKLTVQIEIFDLSCLETNMRRAGLAMKSEQEVREFFAAVMFTGLGLLQNEHDFPTSEFIELMKDFLTNKQKGKAT